MQTDAGAGWYPRGMRGIAGPPRYSRLRDRQGSVVWQRHANGDVDECTSDREVPAGTPRHVEGREARVRTAENARAGGHSCTMRFSSSAVGMRR